MSCLLMIVRGSFGFTHFEINQTSILVFFCLRSMLTSSSLLRLKVYKLMEVVCSLHKNFNHSCLKMRFFYITYPHTPQQNGLAKRRHRSVVKVSLSQMFHSKVPNDYWTYSFLTAVHVLKRRPYAVLSHHISPYFALYEKDADYTSLRVFGCSCYPCLRPYNQHKF